MEALDDEGRLFGVINVVDALVVLLVLAVGLAGVSLLFDGPSADRGATETRYVTLDAGTQPDFIARQVNEGDANEFGSYNLTVTDVYLAPGGDGTRTVLRAAVRGPRIDDQIRVDGAPLRLGRELFISTSTYNVSGTIADVGTDPGLPTSQTPVVVRGNLSNEAASVIQPGDEVAVGDRTSVVVEDVAKFETGDPSSKLVTLVANLSTFRTGDAVRFGTTRLQSGQSLSFPVDGQLFSGEIQRLGGAFNRTTRDVLVTSVVDTEEADRIAPGDTYRVAGEPLATVRNVTVYGTNDPDRKRVFVGLTLETLGYADQPLFGTTFLETGASVPFRTTAYEFSGTITRLGALEQQGTETTATVTLLMTEVRPERADDIRAGMTEVGGGETVARLTDVQSRPATVVLTSEDGQIFAREHPVLRDLTITADLAVRETATGVRFKGQPLQIGRNVTLDLGSTTVRATVVSIDA